MTPQSKLSFVEKKIEPSLTYKVDLEKKRIIGTVDNIEAIVQAILKNFYTERNAYIIYSKDYGINIEQYIAQDFDFIQTDMLRTIEECLKNDDRVLSIEDFECKQGNDVDSIIITFRVNTVIGSTVINSEVKIG